MLQGKSQLVRQGLRGWRLKVPYRFPDESPIYRGMQSYLNRGLNGLSGLHGLLSESGFSGLKD